MVKSPKKATKKPVKKVPNASKEVIKLPSYAQTLDPAAVKGDLAVMAQLMNNLLITAQVFSKAADVYAENKEMSALFLDASNRIMLAVSKARAAAQHLYDDISEANNDAFWLGKATPVAPTPTPDKKAAPSDPSIS